MSLSVDRIKQLEVERISVLASHLQPTQDLRPHAQIYLPGVSQPVAIMLEMPGEPELRSLISDFIAAVAQKLDAEALVLTMMMWVSAQSLDTAERTGRRECIWITIESKAAAGGALVFDVTRRDDASPRLETPVWLDARDEAALDAKGRFANLLRRPLAEMDSEVLELAEMQAQAIREKVNQQPSTRH